MAPVKEAIGLLISLNIKAIASVILANRPPTTLDIYLSKNQILCYNGLAYFQAAF